jgi:D-alanyl-D-alanine carboxypeptidase
LAGFVDTKDGHRLAFAAYINFVPFVEMNEESTKKVGQALGEIAAAAWADLVE